MGDKGVYVCFQGKSLTDKSGSQAYIRITKSRSHCKKTVTSYFMGHDVSKKSPDPLQ